MNKITTTLAGLAIVAAASVAPAFAQGSFTTSGPFVFTFTPTSFSVNNLAVAYNPFNTSVSSSGFLTLTGGTEFGMSTEYDNTMLTFTPTGGGSTITDVVPVSFVNFTGSTGLYSITSSGMTANNNSYNLTGGAPVPEASTVLSFGALLALGGLAILRKKTAVNSAA